MYFLELIQEFDGNYKQQIEELHKEANELLSIIVASLKTSRENYSKSKLKRSVPENSSFVIKSTANEKQTKA